MKWNNQRDRFNNCLGCVHFSTTLSLNEIIGMANTDPTGCGGKCHELSEAGTSEPWGVHARNIVRDDFCTEGKKLK